MEWIVIRGVVEDINARQNVFRRNVVVDTENKLGVANLGYRIRFKKIAWTIGKGQISINVVLDHRVDWHLIIGIRVAGGWICQLHRGQQFAEISRPFGRAQHRQRAGVLAFAPLGPLVRSEEKQFIFLNGKTKRPSENVSAQNRHGLQKVVAGIEGGIAEKFERAAVDLIGSGLDDLIDDAAGSSSILGRVVVGENLELRHGIGIRIDNNVIAQEIVVVGSVKQKGHGFRTLPAHRERIARAVVLIGSKNACLQKPQLQSVTLHQRKLQDALRGLHFAEGRADRVHLRDIALDLHHLTDGANLQRHVQPRILIDLESDPGVYVFFKTPLLNRELISTDRHECERIVAIFICGDAARNVRVRVAQSHFCTSDHGTRRILDRSSDERGGLLRLCSCSQQHDANG